MQPLEESIRTSLIPAITKQRTISDAERNLLALPPRMGGLGIVNPTKMSDNEYKNSKTLTESLKNFVIEQDTMGQVNEKDIRQISYDISKQREKAQDQELQKTLHCLDEKTKKKVEMAKETGASNWLSSLPIKANGFQLNKTEFMDAIALRYGWKIENLPDLCRACGQEFTPEHANVCQKGGFVCMRHDEVRDITCEVLKEVCREVTKEPTLQPLSGEKFTYRTASTEDNARVDGSARGFWTRGEKVFFDVRIFEPLANSYKNMSLEQTHIKHEKEKMNKYGERIRQIEQGTFTPLVFTTSGGMAQQAQCFYKRLAELMAEKKHEPKGYFTSWLRVRLSFALLRSSLLCLRGTRSSKKKHVDLSSLVYEDVVVESRIEKHLD